MSEERRKTIISKINESDEICPLDDGFQYYWPDRCGALSAFDLRCIADELDRLNAPLVKELDEYFNEQK